MPTSFRKCHDNEFLLLPVDMRDWLPEGHLVYPVRDMVRELDLFANGHIIARRVNFIGGWRSGYGLDH